jgi:hypothetical protein
MISRVLAVKSDCVVLNVGLLSCREVELKLINLYLCWIQRMLLDLIEFKQDQPSQHIHHKGDMITNLCSDSPNHCILLMLCHAPARHDPIIKKEDVCNDG